MQKPDAPVLAILDWMMPEMNGPDVVRLIRAVQTDRPPYIIMLTSKSEKADIITGLDAGADDYLSKPFDPGELRARIEVGRRILELQATVLAATVMPDWVPVMDPVTVSVTVMDCALPRVLRVTPPGKICVPLSPAVNV